MRIALAGLMAWLVAAAALAQEPPAVADDGAAAPEPPPATTPRPDDVFLDKRRGIEAYRKGQYEAAADLFSRYYQRAYSKSVVVDAAELLLPALLATGRFDEGLKILADLPARAASYRPKEPDPANPLDPAAWQLSDLEKRQFAYWEGRLWLAKRDLGKAVGFLGLAGDAASPAELRVKALLWRARAYVDLKDWERAGQDFETVDELTNDPEIQMRAQLGRVESLVYQNRFVEAEAKITAAWETMPPAGRTRLGVLQVLVLLATDNPDAAYKAFSERLGAATDLLDNSSHLLVLRNLANRLREVGKPAEALTVLARLFPLTKDESWRRQLLLDMSEAAAAAGNLAEAVARLRQYLQLFPEDPRGPEIRFRIGEILEKEKPAEAVATYRTVGGNEKAATELRYRAWLRVADNLRRGRVDGGAAAAIEAYLAAAGLPVPAAQKADVRYQAAELTFHELGDQRLAAERYQKVADDHRGLPVAEDSRMKQAQALAKLKRFRQAAAAYELFREEYPESPRDGQVLLEKATVLRSAAAHPEAMQDFLAFQRKYPDTSEAPMALVQAASCAQEIGNYVDALQALNTVIGRYDASPHFPEALYLRTYLHLSQGRNLEAVEDGTSFVTRFSTASPENKERAAHVYLWLGDHYASEGRHDTAESTFVKLIDQLPETADAPTALYEAAKAAWNQARNNKDNREDLTRAARYLDRLFDEYLPKEGVVADRVHAQAAFLRGDVLSLAGDFGEAATWFLRTMELVPGSELAWAAQGRLGECEFSLAASAEDGTEQYKQALARFEGLIEARGVNPGLVEMARYRAARIHELLGDLKAARLGYRTIFYGEVERRQVTSSNWFYYARAGYDLARLFLAENNRADAINVYRDMAKRKELPIAADAAEKAAELEREYQP